MPNLLIYLVICVFFLFHFKLNRDDGYSVIESLLITIFQYAVIRSPKYISYWINQASLRKKESFSQQNNLAKIFGVVLDFTTIEIIEGDAVDYSTGKKYPQVYKYYWLIPCLLFQSYRQVSAQIIRNLKKVLG